jgi:tetratricopeptide (TPR) repeat protein
MFKVMALMVLSVMATAAEPTPLLPHPIEGRDQLPEALDQFSTPVIEESTKIPPQGHESSEVEIAKGLIQLNGGRLNEADAEFKKALEKDRRNFLAMEYLASVQERRNDYRGAIGWLAKAKHLAPAARSGLLNFQIGRLYLVMGDRERSAIYLRLAIEQKGHLTAAHYLLGYLYYKDGKFFEAHEHLNKARMSALRIGSREAEREMLQAINYYLGEVYARLGFNQYAIVLLRQTEVGDSWEIRNAAWRVHSELNHPTGYLNLGLFGQYDSNVAVLPIDETIRPVEFSSGDSLGSVLTVNAGYQTKPAKRWVLGIDGGLYLNNHFRNQMAEFDVMQFSGAAWVNFWNLRDWSLTARYFFDHALVNRNAFSTYQDMNGPMFIADYFPFQRWNWSLGFQYRLNSFATDPPIAGPDRRSGHTYVGFATLSLRAPTPRFRPTLGYIFEKDDAQGQNFQSNTHTLFGDADYRLFERTHLLAGLKYSFATFPSSIQGREDTAAQAHLTINYIADRHWLYVFDLTQVGVGSTNMFYSYKRMVVTTGVTYHL